MASISASYINANLFTMTGDYSHALVKGMAVRTDCGVDGIRIVYCRTVDYKGGKTIVYTIPGSSAELTANLSVVDFSCIKPNTEKGHGNFGNIPIDWAWAYRGYRRGLRIEWQDYDILIIKAGSMHYYDRYEGKECILILESDITWSGFNSMGLAANSWHFIYIYPPQENTCIIDPSTSSFFISTQYPSFDSQYFLWYHPTEQQAKCIGYFQTHNPGTNGVLPFTNFPNYYLLHPRYTWERYEYRWTGAYIQNPAADVPLLFPSSNIRIMMNIHFQGFWGFYDSRYVYIKPYTNNWADNPNGWIIYHQGVQAIGSSTNDIAFLFLPIDSSRVYTIYTNSDFASSYGYCIRLMSRGFFQPVGFSES